MAPPRPPNRLAAQHDELSSSRGQPSRREGGAVSKKPAPQGEESVIALDVFLLTYLS